MKLNIKDLGVNSTTTADLGISEERVEELNTLAKKIIADASTKESQATNDGKGLRTSAVLEKAAEGCNTPEELALVCFGLGTFIAQESNSIASLLSSLMGEEEPAGVDSTEEGETF